MYVMNILLAAREAFKIWGDAENNVLSDDAWHMGTYYNETRTKVSQVDSSTACESLGLPGRLCNLPMKGRTEYLPRRNAEKTGIRTLLKFPDQANPIPPNEYDPPDVRMWMMETPDGEFDFLNVVESGTSGFGPQRKRIISGDEKILSSAGKPSAYQPGKGMWSDTRHAADNCDGSLDSHCGRAYKDCMLSGQNDHRGKFVLGSYSGWLILNLDEVKNGLIVLRFETWLSGAELIVTKDWKCENNECPDDQSRRLRGLESGGKVNSTRLEMPQSNRMLKAAPAPFCDEYKFHFAINGGPETIWGVDRGTAMYLTVLDDPSVSGKDVEVAFKMTGCANTKALGFSHIYWS
jgi:hypothetical protein